MLEIMFSFCTTLILGLEWYAPKYFFCRTFIMTFSELTFLIHPGNKLPSSLKMQNIPSLKFPG